MSMTISYDQEIMARNKEWANSLNLYSDNKKNLEWGHNKRPDVITTKMVKAKDVIFNPVTQSYNDKQLDHNLREQDKKSLKDIISKNYDRSLRYEQTYNVVNRDDKFKVFKEQPDYPILKSDPVRTKLDKQRINYNILSNYTLDKHNFVKPELRPVINDELHQDKKKINLNLYRDFDIISNKYKVSDRHKSLADKNIAEYEAAKKFWKTHDYNLVSGRYYDDDRNLKMKNIPDFYSNKKHYESHEQNDTYNPVTNVIYNKNKIDSIDKVEKNKKKRFEIRYDMENHYRNKSIALDLKKEMNPHPRLSYNRYKYEDRRGYDILSLDKIKDRDYTGLNIKDKETSWQQLVNNVEEKNKGNLEKNMFINSYERDPMVDYHENKYKNERTQIKYQTQDPDNLVLNRRSQEQSSTKMINPNMIELNSAIKLKQTDSNAPIQKNEWFNKGKDNDLNLHRLQGNIVSLGVERKRPIVQYNNSSVFSY